jgi:hypothetical protein
VSISADATPLQAVLDEVARQTGMKVVYEGARPSMLVHLRVQAPSVARAVVDLMAGVPVGFAMRLDPTGRGVETLILVSNLPAPVAGTDQEPFPAGTEGPPPEPEAFVEPQAPEGEGAERAQKRIDEMGEVLSRRKSPTQANRPPAEGE